MLLQFIIFLVINSLRMRSYLFHTHIPKDCADAMVILNKYFFLNDNTHMIL